LWLDAQRLTIPPDFEAIEIDFDALEAHYPLHVPSIYWDCPRLAGRTHDMSRSTAANRQAWRDNRNRAR
jgi:hypothetical protein